MDMDTAAEGAVRGTIMGFVKTITDWVHDERCKRRLRAMLQDKRFDFGRTIGQLSANIGADHATTQRFLIAIGARPSETDRTCGR
jgi:hypothetical protein